MAPAIRWGHSFSDSGKPTGDDRLDDKQSRRRLQKAGKSLHVYLELDSKAADVGLVRGKGLEPSRLVGTTTSR